MSDNPYLPPTAETDVPDAPQAHGWFVRDGFLHVEPNAQLPMVDLFTGETADRMILHSMKITKNPIWLICLIWIAVGLVTFSFTLENSLEDTHFKGIAGPLGFVSGLAAIIGATLTRSFKFNTFFTRKSSGKVSLLSWSETLLVIALAVLLLVLWMLPLLHYKEARKTAESLIVAVFVARILLPFSFKRLTCRRSFGSHFEIRGVHPVALEQLRKLSQG